MKGNTMNKQENAWGTINNIKTKKWGVDIVRETNGDEKSKQLQYM